MNAIIQVVDEGNSPAQRLINALNKDPDIQYVAYIAELSTAKELLTIRKTKKQLNSTTVVIDNTDVTSFSEKTSIPLEETPQSYAASIIKALSINENSELLLCCMWMSKAQLRYFDLYPSVLGMDVTHGTNSEKRPLFRSVVISPNKKITTVANGYLPSEGAWVFGWILKTGLPQLFNNENTMSQVSVPLTDEDRQCVSQVDAAIVEKVLPNGRHRICCWHKVDRGYILKVRGKKKTTNDVMFVDDCRDWFYSFTTDIDTERKEIMHIKNFELWLRQQKQHVSKKLFKFTTTFWQKIFKYNLHKLCFRHYKSRPGGDERSTSFTESANSALKRDTMGPAPNQPLDRSQAAIADHKQRRIDGQQSRAMNNLTTKAFVGDHPPETIEMEARKTFLYDHLVDAVVVILFDQWCQSKKYIFYKISTNKYLVQHRLPTADGTVTKYIRTSLVQILPYENGQYYVVCSCHHYYRKNIPCRHIYCVIDELPAPHHCGVREQKPFEAFYGKDETTIEFTNQCNRVLEKKLKGPVFKLPIKIVDTNDATSTVPLSEFTRPISTVIALNPIESEEDSTINNEKEDEMDAEMDEHRFNNAFDNYGSDNNESVDGSVGNALCKVNNRNMPFKNGYTSTQPIYNECTRMITDEASMTIANACLVDMREKLYTYQSQNKKKKKTVRSKKKIENEIVSLPAYDTDKRYKRLVPANSPTSILRQRKY